MKILTFRQPWATLIMQGNKKFEIKEWPTNYRGEIVIHAAKGVDREALRRLRGYLPDELPIGKFLGRVTLMNCIKCDENFKNECLNQKDKELYFRSEFENNYAWELGNIVIFDEPIDVKGDITRWQMTPNNSEETTKPRKRRAPNKT